MLASILEGAMDRARLEYDLLSRLHPEAEGELGGRRGKYVVLLAAIMQQAETWPAEARPRGWTTLGGSPGLGGVSV